MKSQEIEIAAMPLSVPYMKNLLDMIEAIEQCIQARRHVPAMVLMYALMDSLAWAGADRKSPNLRARFEQWVKRWLLPNLPPSNPPITETDLYAARCGILHTGTGVSELYLRGEAKRFLYAWGTGRADVLEYAIATELPAGHVALHYGALFIALRQALVNFTASAEHDAVLRSRLQEASSFQYTSVPAPDSQ